MSDDNTNANNETAENLLPFTVRVHLGVNHTVASLPVQIRKRLPIKQQRPQRGERFLYLPSTEPDLIDTIVKCYGDRFDSFSPKGKVSLVTSMPVDHAWPAWVNVHHIDPEVDSPFAALCEAFIRQVRHARSRGLVKEPVFKHEKEVADAKKEADAADAARKRRADAEAIVTRLVNTRLDALYPFLVDAFVAGRGWPVSTTGLGEILDAAEEAYRDAEAVNICKECGVEVGSACSLHPRAGVNRYPAPSLHKALNKEPAS